MKSTKKTPDSPVSAAAPGKAGARLLRQPDHMKDRQKLPQLPIEPSSPSRDHIVPANELDLTNFYHL